MAIYSANTQYDYTVGILGNFSGGSITEGGPANGVAPHPIYTDDYGDELEYADKVISYAVNEFMTIDEDIFEDERYDEWEEMLIEMC